jgi:myo-inositol 2-dehydrogenase/D-chiro-inositol 1-dehydrogenase
MSIREHSDFRTRFAQAYDTEIQEWIDAATNRQVIGPNSWDGYMANVVSDAGVEAQKSGTVVKIKRETRPDFYAN